MDGLGAMRVAAIDIGTNTVLLLIAELQGDRLLPLHQEQRFGRLGQGVERSGRLQEAAVERVLRILRDYARQARAWGAERIGAVATSAVREASNPEALLDRAWQELGLHIEVLSGEEEAYWSFLGVRSAFPEAGGLIVLDIGGGSTELIQGTGEGVGFRQSLPLGCVRLTERFFPIQPPEPEQISAARRWIGATLASLPRFDVRLPLIGVAGTVTSLAALEAGLLRYEAGRIERYWIAEERVRDWIRRLGAMAPEEVLALGPEILAGRADVWLAGLLILEGVLEHLQAPGLYASDRGLRYGWALRLAGNFPSDPRVAFFDLPSG